MNVTVHSPHVQVRHPSAPSSIVTAAEVRLVALRAVRLPFLGAELPGEIELGFPSLATAELAAEQLRSASPLPRDVHPLARRVLEVLAQNPPSAVLVISRAAEEE